MFSVLGDIIGLKSDSIRFKCLKCRQFHKETLDFIFEITQLLQNDFSKKQYIPLNTTTPGYDRICLKNPHVQNYLSIL